MDIDALTSEWEDLSKEFTELEECNKKYVQLLEQLYSHQQKCFIEIKHQRYRINQILTSLKHSNSSATPEEKAKIEELEKNTLKRKAQLYELEQSLPAKSGLYLKIILGDVNVSILNRNDKVRYKDDYEKFKLVLNVIGLLLAFLNLLVNFRVLELAYIFLLVWYYCTLTIRESILKVNGSRIKGWWRAHHFISTVAAGVLLVWPQGEHWSLFRNQFMYFNVYISLVQYLQFGYQKGLLYRLKALGERHNMDITIEGFHSWMWRGLSFLLPFLFIGYAFQAYNAYTLYYLSFTPDAPWQVPVMCGLFFVLFVGNLTTTLLVVPEKRRERTKERYRLISMGKSMKLRKMMRSSISDSDTVKFPTAEKSDTVTSTSTPGTTPIKSDIKCPIMSTNETEQQNQHQENITETSVNPKIQTNPVVISSAVNGATETSEAAETSEDAKSEGSKKEN